MCGMVRGAANPHDPDLIPRTHSGRRADSSKLSSIHPTHPCHVYTHRLLNVNKKKEVSWERSEAAGLIHMEVVCRSALVRRALQLQILDGSVLSCSAVTLCLRMTFMLLIRMTGPEIFLQPRLKHSTSTKIVTVPDGQFIQKYAILLPC